MGDRVLVTGADGFTGRHFIEAARRAGLEPVSLEANLTDSKALEQELQNLKLDYVVHLAAISAVTHEDEQELYRVNLFGTLNLLKALQTSGQSLKKVLIASSANVYGNVAQSPVAESTAPGPVNHYAMSKLAMEYMLAGYMTQLPIVITRPFNYTGVGHDDRFVIPKLVDHFRRRAAEIELGNTVVQREFNDVRTIVQVYLGLLETGTPGEIYNVCSGTPYSLDQVIELLTEISGHEMEVRVNPAFLRANELMQLYGDRTKLESCIGRVEHKTLRETLAWMLDRSD